MLFGVAHAKSSRCSTRARTFKRTSLPPWTGCAFSIATAGSPTSIERDNQCRNFRCHLSRLELPLDSLRFWLDVEWGPKIAAHSCTAVNEMMTRGLGNRVKP